MLYCLDDDDDDTTPRNASANIKEGAILAPTLHDVVDAATHASAAGVDTPMATGKQPAKVGTSRSEVQTTLQDSLPGVNLILDPAGGALAASLNVANAVGPVAVAGSLPLGAKTPFAPEGCI